jgi:predicted RNase H-like HicB family nuclease
MKYLVILHEEDGQWWAEVPALPGCYTYADTRDEVVQNVKEAIACHLDQPTEAEPVNVEFQEVGA